MCAGATSDERIGGELIDALTALAREKRLSTLVHVANSAGITEVSSDNGRLRLINAFRDFEETLERLDRIDDTRALRQAIREAHPDLSDGQVDEIVTTKLVA